MKKYIDMLSKNIHPHLLRRKLTFNPHNHFEDLLYKERPKVFADKEVQKMPYVKKLLHECQFVDVPWEADYAVIWNTQYYANRFRTLLWASIFNLPLFVLEDGLLRSLDIAARGEAGLSIIIDDMGVYFDPFHSRIRWFLESDFELDRDKRVKIREIIGKIISYHLSKYNLIPPSSMKIGRNGRKKVLVIDQRFNDQSVIASKMDENTFKNMLNDAIEENPGADILVKTHPDANSKIFRGYYSNLDDSSNNIIKITEDVNPIALLKNVDTVYVGSSQMGFEALMLNKKVICYGAPFYSGWGLTEDRGLQKRCRRTRTLEDIFYAIYERYTRYYNPEKEKICSLEEFVEYLHKKTGW